MTELLRRPTDPPTAQGARTIRVAVDGSGDFRSVQAAVDAAPESNLDRTTIQIAPGTYVGLVVIPRSKINLSFVGAGTDKTILSYALAVNDPVPANAPDKMFGTGVIVLGDGFEARDLTFRNSSGDHGQAMALRVQADRVSITNCRLLGWQDTLLAHSGRQYYRDCYIEGRVDFIYGRATAVFDRCEIHSKNGGYITASSAEQDQPFGFVFLDCRITGWGAPAYLGRPWRDYAAVAFIRCEIGAHIRAEGWHNWSKPEREQTARFAEFGNTGRGAERAVRVSWSKQLTPEQAAEYTIENILAGDDGWNPSRR
jgi:pectinesterase